MDKDRLKEDLKIAGQLRTNLYVRHVNSGRMYIVNEIVRDATNNREGQKMVCYTNIETGMTWCREMNEFCDGRFEYHEMNAFCDGRFKYHGVLL